MNIWQDLIKGTVVPIVLAMLKDRPMYGYEIVRVVNARTNGRFEWREGTLYPALHRLEADGLVTSKWQDGASGPGAGRPRKYYSITGKGLAELAHRTAEWKEFSAAVNACLIGG
ncbi:MAG: PadR family transcriptional regulator [Phycisphaerae bacterium]|nr:PadR family transcriptional regulator [Phycisphaerae bacterium]